MFLTVFDNKLIFSQYFIYKHYFESYHMNESPYNIRTTCYNKIMKPIHIQNTNISDLELYKENSETPLRRINEPDPGVFIAESALVMERAINAGFEPISVLLDEEALNNCSPLLNRPEFNNTPVYILPKEELIKITGYNITRGVLSLMSRKRVPDIESILSNPQINRIAVLEEVTNPTNVGAIFRSAAALFIDAVLLTGGCADPLYRRCLRVSMGNVFSVPWTYIDIYPYDNLPLVLKKYNYTSASLALNDNSISIEDPILKSTDKLALILGSEGYGLKVETINASDHVVKIPMAEGVDSLNVAAASALAFWEITRRH